jgi:hypothetical protein
MRSGKVNQSGFALLYSSRCPDNVRRPRAESIDELSSQVIPAIPGRFISADLPDVEGIHAAPLMLQRRGCGVNSIEAFIDGYCLESGHG